MSSREPTWQASQENSVYIGCGESAPTGPLLLGDCVCVHVQWWGQAYRGVIRGIVTEVETGIKQTTCRHVGCAAAHFRLTAREIITT